MTPFELGGQNLLAEGDSRTFGNDASDPATLSWAYLLATERGGGLYNDGNPGMYLQPADGFPSFNPVTVQSKSFNNSKYMTLAFGTNDSKGPAEIFTVALFKAALISALDYLVAHGGWSYEDIITPTITYFPLVTTNGLESRIAAYNQAILEVAKLKNTIYVDPYTFMAAQPDVASLFNADGIHELDAGHRLDANFFEAQDYTPINNKTLNVKLGRNVIFV